MIQNKKKTKLFDMILSIIIIILSILVIYWFIQLLLGGSPGLSEFNFALIIFMASILFKVYREVGEIKVETKHISIGVKEGFNKIKEDTLLIKEKLKI